MQYGCRATQQSVRGGGTTYQQLVSRRNKGVVERFKMIQKGFRKGYHCLQATRTLEYTGNHNSVIYTRTLVCSGQQNSDRYRIPELWCIQDTRTLVLIGYQNSGFYRIQEFWWIQDTRTLVYTGYNNSGVYRTPEL